MIDLLPRRVARTHLRASVLAVVTGVLLCGGPSHGRGTSPSPVVEYVAGHEAYLNVGRDDGVKVGDRLDLVRRREKPLPCEVTEVSAHRAVCRSDKAQAGDRIASTALGRPAPGTAAPAAPAPSRMPIATPEENSRRREALLAAPLAKVVYARGSGSSAPAWRTRASVTARQQAWMTAGGGAFVRPALDAAVRADLGLLPGLHANAALRVQGDVLAPKDQRFRPEDPVELYVYDLALAIDRGPVRAALGRFRPRKAPGITLLDGAQVGVALFREALEVGVYAGSIPDLVRMTPGLERPTAGVYAGLDVAGGRWLQVLPRARASVIAANAFDGARVEVEAQLAAIARDLVEVGGSARVAMGTTGDVKPWLDGARVDAALLVYKPLTLRGGWRYLAPLTLDIDGAGRLPSVGGAHHGDLHLALAPTQWLSLGGRAGVGVDLATQQTRAFAGPEATLPRAFGDAGALTMGYVEELGFWRGRNAYVSSHLTPTASLHILARASYFENEALGDAVRETALMLGTDTALLPWLTLRARVHAQGALPSLDAVKRAAPLMLLADIGLNASL